MGRNKRAARPFLFGLNILMPTFITPFSGSAELTAGNGLESVSVGLWEYSRPGYNDGATFGVSLGGPTKPGKNVYIGPSSPQQTLDSGELHLQAENWTIASIGNALTSYTDPESGQTYGPEKCRITVTGRWEVIRQPNSNSFNSQGVIYSNGFTRTDLGDREMGPVFLLTYYTPYATYIKQGAGVTGGAIDTFSDRVFFCKCTELVTSDNSNREFQSNSISRPAWVYTYSKSWQTD